MKQKHEFRSLISGFIESVERFPSRHGLVVDREAFTYDALGQAVSNIAATITASQQDVNPLAAILAHRSLTAYTGILAILASGRGYVPLNAKHPIARIQKMFVLSRSDIIIVGRESCHVLEALLPDIERPLTVILPDVSDGGSLPSRFPRHRFIAASQLCRGPRIPDAPRVRPDSVAYLLFTSGSTGEPKGVAVKQENVTSYVRYACERYKVSEYDRFSQQFDMTFDLSVHDMFVCWERGACLYSVPERSVMGPAKFIKDHQLTMWFSVPSVVAFMLKMNMLKAGCFPSLRHSLFCGEPLPAMFAKAWQGAAPNSVVENLYGPTETTIAITHYRWDDMKSPSASINGIVPIGWVFDGQAACVIDRERNVLPTGEVGELCLSGSQVTNGYWNNPQKSLERFIRLPGFGDTLWYRTGDLVKQDENGCLYYLGRMDNQVKIRGYRVELQEIDFVLKKASGTEEVVSVAWPVRDGSADGIIAFISGRHHFNEQRIVNYCKEVLPEYMVPRRVYNIDKMPLNINGKIDRSKLIDLLETSGHEACK